MTSLPDDIIYVIAEFYIILIKMYQLILSINLCLWILELEKYLVRNI